MIYAKPFELLYFDLWTATIVSIIGAKYFMFIVDNSIIYTWIYLIKTKDEYKTFVTKSFYSKVKAL